MNKIKINWFGSGVEIKRVLLPEDVHNDWNEIALKQNRSLVDLLVDPFFYYNLKNKKYNSFEDVPCEKFAGLLNENKNQLEFWFNRKKVFKTNTIELFNEAVLFPIFNIKQLPEYFTNNQGIYIVQKEIGNLGIYELQTNTTKLLLDDFTFETLQYQNTKIISSIKHQSQSFTFLKKDTVITNQVYFEIK